MIEHVSEGLVHPVVVGVEVVGVHVHPAVNLHVPEDAGYLSRVSLFVFDIRQSLSVKLQLGNERNNSVSHQFSD